MLDGKIINMDNIISIIGICVPSIIAIIGGLYAVLTDTKKYELTEQYKKDLLDWHNKVVFTMKKILHYRETGEYYSNNFKSVKVELLSELSALAEVGRFYFPNVSRKDEFGMGKPPAYRGYRHIEIEFLLHFYFIAKNDAYNYNNLILETLQRNFTSYVFAILEPEKQNKVRNRKLLITLPDGESIDDIIQNGFYLKEEARKYTRDVMKMSKKRKNIKKDKGQRNQIK